MTIKERLTQLVAGGVQVAMATDHNAVTDYEPEAQNKAVSRNKAFSRWLKTFPGCEATTRRSYFGHFNLFPLDPKAPVPRYENTPPKKLAASWRARKDKPIIQVNHPRLSYIGTFNQVGFDAHHHRAYGPGFFTDFDALEVFNGVRIYSPKRLETNLQDWYLLLNKGMTPTATGGSDAHLPGFHAVGYPKNYLFFGHEDPQKVTSASLKKVILNHRVVVSSGPFINITQSTTTLTNPPQTLIGSLQKGSKEVLITVETPTWLPVDTLEIISNGKLINKITIPQTPASKNPAKANAAKANVPARISWTKTLNLAPKKDAWFVFIVKSRSHNPTLFKSTGCILAFTNPIWIDVDGDGKIKLPPPPATPTR